jgi:hypothetical protein
MSTVLNNFDTWKKFLGNRVAAAKNMGMGEDEIAKLAYEIGQFLEQKIDPENREERVLKELWDAGNDAERQTMASLMVKVAERNS